MQNVNYCNLYLYMYIHQIFLNIPSDSLITLSAGSYGESYEQESSESSDDEISIGKHRTGRHRDSGELIVRMCRW